MKNNYDSLFRKFLGEVLEAEHEFGAPLYVVRGEGTDGYDPIIDYFFSHKESLAVDGTVEQKTIAGAIEEFSSHVVPLEFK
ncbi:hypothetical protein [Corticicoccus populi]|uniref:Uncharacterized protein n=1 Tax=Corticicoccus populi TaxID=1812821 RepID=A0ABW5WR54_9STAP